MKKSFCSAIFLALCFLFAPTAWSQAQFTTGAVQGDVLDEKGGTVPGASVEAKNLDTNYIRSESTNGDGHFQFLNLAPGRYTLTITKSGFTTIVQENVHLTVGQVLSIPVTVKVSAVAQQIVVTDVPVIETTKTESSSTLEESAIATTPVLGRKFEDLLTLTPGVSISQGPDGDEININGQRGIFNNISLDGGDYNNGFFGEQVGGQRAAIDITLEAVKEFQIVASGANAEFGRSAGSSINVITKSGTNNFHGSAFEYFRTEALTAATSDGKPLDNFRRNQFGGSLGGPIVRDKLFFFGATEGIRENLTRKNLSDPIGTPCLVQDPVFNSNITDAQIDTSLDCQRLVLLNFFKTADLSPYQNTDEGRPVDHPVRNASAFGRVDYNWNAKNQIFGSYSFDWSKNTSPIPGKFGHGIRSMPRQFRTPPLDLSSALGNHTSSSHRSTSCFGGPTFATAFHSSRAGTLGSSAANGSTAATRRFSVASLTVSTCLIRLQDSCTTPLQPPWVTVSAPEPWNVPTARLATSTTVAPILPRLSLVVRCFSISSMAL